MSKHQRAPAWTQAADPPARPQGWVTTYQVNADRSVTMTCHDPVTGQETPVRVLPLELETMLAAARKLTL